MRESGGRPIIVVTGMSGAGKSSALGILEDIGYEVVDNLPLSLLPNLLRPLNPSDGRERGGEDSAEPRPIAVCADVRSRQFDPTTFQSIVGPVLNDPELSLTLLFVDCDDEILRRRFTETRRRHPLACPPEGQNAHWRGARAAATCAAPGTS